MTNRKLNASVLLLYHDYGIDEVWEETPVALKPAPTPQPQKAVEAPVSRPISASVTPKPDVAAKPQAAPAPKTAPPAAEVIVHNKGASTLILVTDPLTAPEEELLARMLTAIGLELATLTRVEVPAGISKEPLILAAVSCAPTSCLVMSRHATKALLSSNPLKARGTWNKVGDIPAFFTLTPKFVLGSADYRRPVWEDLQAFQEHVDQKHIDQSEVDKPEVNQPQKEGASDA